MSTSDAAPNTSRRRWWLMALIVAGLALAGYYWRHPPGFVTCPSQYPECRGEQAPPMPQWEIPTNPPEREAYEHAHALKLPACEVKPEIYDQRRSYPMPNPPPCPVPFDFRAARIKEGAGGPELAEQYFQHLCRTEAGEFIFRQIKDVEGVYLMRPRRHLGDTPLDFDRYRMEDPTAMRQGDQSEPWRDDDGRYQGLPLMFLQPLGGEYRYLEQPDWSREGRLVRYVRELNPEAPYGLSNGVTAGNELGGLRLPLLVNLHDAESRQARYGVTWRGLRRSRDREFAIAGGELMIVELETNEVIAIRRLFALSGKVRSLSRIWWTNARHCPAGDISHNSARFAERVLLPLPDVNAGAQDLKNGVRVP